MLHLDMILFFALLIFAFRAQLHFYEHLVKDNEKRMKVVRKIIKSEVIKPMKKD